MRFLIFVSYFSVFCVAQERRVHNLREESCIFLEVALSPHSSYHLWKNTCALLLYCKFVLVSGSVCFPAESWPGCGCGGAALPPPHPSPRCQLAPLPQWLDLTSSEGRTQGTKQRTQSFCQEGWHISSFVLFLFDKPKADNLSCYNPHPSPPLISPMLCYDIATAMWSEITRTHTGPRSPLDWPKVWHQKCIF